MHRMYRTMIGDASQEARKSRFKRKHVRDDDVDVIPYSGDEGMPYEGEDVHVTPGRFLGEGEDIPGRSAAVETSSRLAPRTLRVAATPTLRRGRCRRLQVRAPPYAGARQTKGRASTRTRTTDRARTRTSAIRTSRRPNPSPKQALSEPSCAALRCTVAAYRNLVSHAPLVCRHLRFARTSAIASMAQVSSKRQFHAEQQ